MSATLTRRDFAALLGCGAPAAVLAGCAHTGAELPADQLALVNPELRPFLPQVRRVEGTVSLNRWNLASARRNLPSAPPLAAPAFYAQHVPGLTGEPDVRVYVINAGVRAGGPRPAILHMHGGGFVTGSAFDRISALQPIAAALDALVVTVDYRLAPETPFPHSLEDNYAALKWLHAHAEALGADPARIGLLGGSAGGGHAAALALAARDRGEVPLAFQQLIYPMLDDRTGSTRKAPRQVGFLGWGAEDNRFAWSALLGAPAGSDRVPSRAVPARAQSLKGLPPTFVGVGSIDLFFPESVAYAERLKAAGVPVQLEIAPGAFHGFDALTSTRLAQRFQARQVAALRAALSAQA